jgi:hypothetical protein
LRSAIDVADYVEPHKDPPSRGIAKSGVNRLAETLGAQLPPSGIKRSLVYINCGAGHAHHCRASDPLRFEEIGCPD